jgi:hypothetical protein
VIKVIAMATAIQAQYFLALAIYFLMAFKSIYHTTSTGASTGGA